MNDRRLHVALGLAPLSNMTEAEPPIEAGTVIEVLIDDHWYGGLITLGGTTFEVRPYPKRWPTGERMITRSVDDVSNWRRLA